MKKTAVSKRNLVAGRRFVVDDRGGRIGVLVDIEEYERMREAQEELDAIRAYDLAKSSGEKPVPYRRAFRSLNRSR